MVDDVVVKKTLATKHETDTFDAGSMNQEFLPICIPDKFAKISMYSNENMITAHWERYT